MVAKYVCDRLNKWIILLFLDTLKNNKTTLIEGRVHLWHQDGTYYSI
ncbi:hypothetical protein [Alkalihalobacterium alkalinitrilicum]|nr:hypothetical protein [Alkalihalobacterium alkalinitrilicum]